MNMEQKAQLYRITHIPSNRVYIGITWGKNHSYLKRFEKHMNGKGSVYIKKLLLSGHTRNDFSIELLMEDTLKKLYDMEEKLSVLYPEGLNGNKGKAIIQSEEGLKVAKEKRKEKMLETRIKISKSLSEKTKKEKLEIRIKISKSLSKDDITYDEIKEKMLYKDKMEKITGSKKRKYTDKERDFVKKKHALKHLNSITSIEKRNNTINNFDEDKKNRIKEKQSISMSLYRENEDEEKRKLRIEKQSKTYRNKSNEWKKKRGEKISKSKKGKTTNQKNITKKRYKKMSDLEFEKWCIGRKEWVVKRAKNLRNEE